MAIDCIFTSINNGYLPKARILAASVRNHHPEARMVLMLSDRQHPALDYGDFDLVLGPEDLDIGVANLQAWLFEHTVVELCTAVKPFAFQHLLRKAGFGTVVYLDPDTVLYSRMEELEAELERSPVVLTPHVTVPAVDTDDLHDGEMLGCLRHGVFNLGFLALRDVGQGTDFVNWWGARCRDYCFDDNRRGLFTDQKWIDLAPAFFPDAKVFRVPSYNVATWNLYYRKVARDSFGQITVNDVFPLRFYHFSGFDIGTHKQMLGKHDSGNACLHEMTEWYSAELDRLANDATAVSYYDHFSDGRKIPADWRRYYRDHPALQRMIPDPYRQQEQVIEHFEGPGAPESAAVDAPIGVAREFLLRNPRLLALFRAVIPDVVLRHLRR